MNHLTSTRPVPVTPESEPDQRPDRAEAEAAIRTLLRWIGDDPTREGLLDTPKRVIKAWEEYGAGYLQDPAEILGRSFEEVAGYDEMVTLTRIPFESHCEHHMAPILGEAHIGYLPAGRVVGISKLARLVDVFAKRLQIQEKMTAEIATALQTHLMPHGAGVVIEAEHHCMTCRGVHKPGVRMTTQSFTGNFRDPAIKADFMGIVTRTRG